MSFEIFNNLLATKKTQQVRALSNYGLIPGGWFKAFSCHLRINCTEDETEYWKSRTFFPLPL